MAHGFAPVYGVVKLSKVDSPTRRVRDIELIDDPVVANARWHITWGSMDHLPTWKLPHWTEYEEHGVDVGDWKHAQEFLNWFAYNIVCCYMWIERITRGMHPVDDVQELLTSHEPGRMAHIFDGTQSPYLLRAKIRLGDFAFKFFQGVSTWDGRHDENVEYPHWGLLRTIELIEERFDDQADMWKKNKKLRRENRAIARSCNYVNCIQLWHLKTTARTLSKLGPSLEV